MFSLGDGEIVPKGDPTHWKELDPKTMKVCLKFIVSHLHLLILLLLSAN